MSIHVSSLVWEQCPCTSGRLLLMLALADHCNDEGICCPSQLSLAKRTRCTERGVQKIIAGLVKEGEIELLREGGGRGNSAQYLLSKYIKGERHSGNSIRGLIKDEPCSGFSDDIFELKIESSNGSKRHSLPNKLLEQPGFEEEWDHYVEHRKKKYPLTPRAKTLICNELLKNPPKAVSALQNCMIQGWRGFKWEWLDKINNQLVPIRKDYKMKL